MNMNFERVRLQMHFRQLYEALGALDAELLIGDAFQREVARWNKILEQRAQAHARSLNASTTHLPANENKSHDNALDI